MTTTDSPRTPTDAEKADIAFLWFCRTRLTPERRVALDAKIAAHAARIAADTGRQLADTVTEATALFGAELRTAIRNQL